MLALLIATSMGGAYAHGMIGSAQIKQNAVKSRHIADGNVKTADIGGQAVASGKIKPRAIHTNHISDHAMWALVDTDGTLIQGHGVLATEKAFDGVYAVRFAKDVTRRALVATPYSGLVSEVQVSHCTTAHPVGSNCSALSPGFVQNPKAASVVTRTSTGSFIAGRFFLVVMPQAPQVFTTSSRLTLRGGASER